MFFFNFKRKLSLTTLCRRWCCRDGFSRLADLKTAEKQDPQQECLRSSSVSAHRKRDTIIYFQSSFTSHSHCLAFYSYYPPLRPIRNLWAHKIKAGYHIHSEIGIDPVQLPTNSSEQAGDCSDQHERENGEWYRVPFSADFIAAHSNAAD